MKRTDVREAMLRIVKRLRALVAHFTSLGEAELHYAEGVTSLSAAELHKIPGNGTITNF